MEIFTTERLIIRRPRKTDLHSYLAYRNNPESMKLQPIQALTEEKAEEFLLQQAAINIDKAEGWIMFALEQKNDGRMIGEVGIYISAQKASLGDIGWSIHPDYQRRGYASEAAPFLLAYAFAERGLHRLTANCTADNVPSTRIMERLGMRREGYFRESLFQNDEWHDECLYALLRDEWSDRH